MTRILALGLVSSLALAAATPVAAAAPSASASIYRFDVSITGMDPKGGPTQYTLVLQENQHGELQTGSNIPLAPLGASQAPRQQIGLEMKFMYELRGSVVVLSGDVELTTADPATPTAGPTLHRIRAESAVPITPGQPALFSSLYDLNTKHRVEITVTAQRLL